MSIEKKINFLLCSNIKITFISHIKLRLQNEFVCLHISLDLELSDMRIIYLQVHGYVIITDIEQIRHITPIINTKITLYSDCKVVSNTLILRIMRRVNHLIFAQFSLQNIKLIISTN